MTESEPRITPTEAIALALLCVGSLPPAIDSDENLARAGLILQALTIAGWKIVPADWLAWPPSQTNSGEKCQPRAPAAT